MINGQGRKIVFAGDIIPLTALAALIACAPAPGVLPNPPAATAGAVPATPLILGVADGETRIRRFPGVSPAFTIKVDERNGGSRDFLMLYEDIPPGGVIPPHRHLLSDEILFVHAGSGTVEVGSKSGQVSPGGTVYIPANTRITLRNTGPGTLSIVAMFARQGFEGYLRESSVLRGEPVVPLSPAELAEIKARNEHHTIYERR